MFCAIYRSLICADTYLYIEKKDDFSRVPELLLQRFAKRKLAMVINLAERRQLAATDTATVRQALVEMGFYLQVPPPVENLLTAHIKTKLSTES